MEQDIDYSIFKFTEIKCPSLFSARFICLNSKCKYCSFICMRTDCAECEKSHNYCKTFRISSFMDKIKIKKRNLTEEIKLAAKVTENIFDDLIKKIQKEKRIIQQKLKYFGLNDPEIELIDTLNKGYSKQIMGDLTSKIYPNLNKKKISATNENQILKHWNKNQQNFHKIVSQFSNIINRTCEYFDSKVTNKVQNIEKFFPGPSSAGIGYRLLYRASQHGFSATKFHEACDGKRNSLVIARTQFNKVVGCYIGNNTWGSNNCYTGDKNKNIFMFSQSCSEKFHVSDQHRKKVMFHNPLAGPTIGNLDFSIMDNSDKNLNSFCIGNSFQNKKWKNERSLQQMYLEFSGSSTGKCKVIQWQVFQLSFKKIRPI